MALGVYYLIFVAIWFGSLLRALWAGDDASLQLELWGPWFVTVGILGSLVVTASLMLRGFFRERRHRLPSAERS